MLEGHCASLVFECDRPRASPYLRRFVVEFPVEVTVINFTVTFEGLEEQLLNEATS